MNPPQPWSNRDSSICRGTRPIAFTLHTTCPLTSISRLAKAIATSALAAEKPKWPMARPFKRQEFFMTNEPKTTAELDYPPLPAPFRKQGAQAQADGESHTTCDLFCIEQMRAYYDLCREAGCASADWRAAVAELVELTLYGPADPGEYFDGFNEAYRCHDCDAKHPIGDEIEHTPECSHHEATKTRQRILDLAKWLSTASPTAQEPVGELCPSCRNGDLYACTCTHPATQQAVPTSEQAGAPAGFALVPMRLTRAMNKVLQDEGWQWEDLLAAANAITESDHQAISRDEPTDNEIRESFKAYGAACTDKHLEAVREVIGNLPAVHASGGAAPVAQDAEVLSMSRALFEQRAMDAKHAAIYRWIISNTDVVYQLLGSWIMEDDAGTDELHDAFAARAQAKEGGE